MTWRRYSDNKSYTKNSFPFFSKKSEWNKAVKHNGMVTITDQTCSFPTGGSATSLPPILYSPFNCATWEIYVPVNMAWISRLLQYH